MTISIETLDVNNWLKICELSVSEEQKQVFPISNVYWIGISRYEEHSELFAIKQDDTYVGLIGGGLDEDGISGYINPLMIDEKFQRQGIAEKAIRLMTEYLIRKYHVPCIHISHQKTNLLASHLYEKLGFAVYSQFDTEICRSYTVDYDVKILSLRDNPQHEDECQMLLLKHFNEFTSNHPAEVLASPTVFPQGYFMLKNNSVIGWVGLYEKEVVSGKVYGWEGTIAQEEVLSEELSPWITPLLIHPSERGNHYGKLLLDHVRKAAGRFGYRTVYLTTGEIGYYEKYGFQEVGLTTFTWGRPTKVYESDAILELEEKE